MKNNKIWCGCASIYDGFIEETRTYEEAKAEDFHHSLYFSNEAAERINEGESIFFWIDNGVLHTDWRNGEIPRNDYALQQMNAAKEKEKE